MKNIGNEIANIGKETYTEGNQSEDEEAGAFEPLLNNGESTRYTTDHSALDNISMLNETSLNDAEGKRYDLCFCLSFFYYLLIWPIVWQLGNNSLKSE